MIDENKVIKNINDYMQKLWDEDYGIGSDTLPTFIAGMIKAKRFIEEQEQIDESW
jgi:hypothetical protein